jgi:DNA-binding PadR family transcriptional regulator
MRENVRSGALTEVTFFVLLALYRPRHGYAVMQFVEEQTGGRLVLGAGSLYGALGTLTKKGWIESVGEDKERRKRYRITAKGRRIAAEEQSRLQNLVKTAEAIMKEGEEQEEGIKAAHIVEGAGR